MTVRNRKTRPRPRPRKAGVTLMEVLIASAILSFAVAAIAQSIVAGQMQTYEALHELRAMALAESLIEEIIAQPYADPEGAEAAGPDAGESDRGDFDNADDYHGYSEDPDNIVDAALVAYPDKFQTFSRAVTCVYGTADSGLGDPVDGLTATVTVTDTAGRTWVASRFIPEPAGGE